MNSVPGILILVKVISQEPFYHHLLLKFGVLDLVAAVVDISEEEIALAAAGVTGEMKN